MKKLMLISVLLLTMTAMNAQRWENFFGSMPTPIILKERAVTNQWFPRPKLQLTAIQIFPGEESETRMLSSFGIGFSWAHFTPQEDVLYQDFSVDLSLLLGGDVTKEKNPLELSVAGTITGWQYMTVGGGYNFMMKKWFALLGASYSFNAAK